MADLFERFAPGTISIANAATTGTGTGTELTAYEKGDLLFVPGRGVVQLSAKPTSDTGFAFVAPYIGTAIVDEEYEWFPIGLLSSLPTKLNLLIASLSGGNLLALSGLTGVAGTYLKFTGPGAFELVSEAELLTGVATNKNVETLAGRSAYDAQDENYSVLVLDVGDGRAAVYYKLSATSADWSGPGYLTGATGEPGGFRDYMDATAITEGVAGEGALRKNHATWAGTTKIWMDMQQRGGSTITGTFARFATVTGTNKGRLVIRGFDGSEHITFRVTGYTVKFGFFELDVVHEAGSPTFSEGDLLFVLPILDGSDGASAYAQAVDAGFVGTLSEWLASLNGDDGLGFNVRGTWTALSGAVAVNDVLTHRGSSWTCIDAHTKGVNDDEPGVGADHLTYWLESAEKGGKGDTGDPGNNGIDGASLRVRVRVVDTEGLDPDTEYEAGMTVGGLVLAENDLIGRFTAGGDAGDGIFVAPAAAAGAASRQAAFSTFDGHVGAQVYCAAGDNAGKTYVCTSALGGTLDTTPLSFVLSLLNEDDFASNSTVASSSQASTKTFVNARRARSSRFADGVNIRASSTDGDTLAMSADFLNLYAVDEAFSGDQITVSTVSVTATLADEGIDGFHAGSVVNETWNYGWVIAQAGGGGIVSIVSDSSDPTEITMPEGYVYAALVASVYVKGSGDIVPFGQIGGKVAIGDIDGGTADTDSLASATSPLTITPLDLSGRCPPEAISATLGYLAAHSTTSNRQSIFYSDSGGLFGTITGSQGVSNGFRREQIYMPILTPQTLWWENNNAGNFQVSVGLHSYELY